MIRALRLLNHCSTCVRMRTAAPRCEKELKTWCRDSFDAMNCGAVAAFCQTELSAPFYRLGTQVVRLASVRKI
jgi:hypothetical protein